MQQPGIRQRLEWLGGSRGRICALILLLLIHIVLSLSYLAALPPFNWPDEPAHFNYVRDLAEGRGLASIDASAWAPAELNRLKATHFESVDPTGPEIDRFRYEAHQPPLYYALASAIYRWQPRIEAVRLLNLALSCGVVVLTWVAGRSLFPAVPQVAWAAALLSALLPMRCFLAVSVSNGVAAELVFTIFVVALARRCTPWTIGFIIGLGLWIHSALLLTLPLYAGWLLFSPLSSSAEAANWTGSRWTRWLVVAGVALAIWSPWPVRNMYFYGTDELSTVVTGALSSGEAEIAAFGHPRPRLGLTGAHGIGAFVALLFNSSWGVFGWMEMFFGRWIQALLGLISIVPALGVVACVRNHFSQSAKGRSDNRCVTWLSLSAATLVLAVAVYSLYDFQPQGRYLLTGSSVFALLYATGVHRIMGRFSGFWIATTSLALGAVNLHGSLHVVPWYLAR